MKNNKQAFSIILLLSSSLFILPLVLTGTGGIAKLSLNEYQKLVETCGNTAWENLEMRLEVDVIRLEVKCSNGKRGVVRTPIFSI